MGVTEALVTALATLGVGVLGVQSNPNAVVGSYEDVTVSCTCVLGGFNATSSAWSLQEGSACRVNRGRQQHPVREDG